MTTISLSSTGPLQVGNSDAMQVYYGHKKKISSNCSLSIGNSSDVKPVSGSSVMVSNFRRQVGSASSSSGSNFPSSSGTNISQQNRDEAALKTSLPVPLPTSSNQLDLFGRLVVPTTKILNPKNIRDSVKLTSIHNASMGSTARSSSGTESPSSRPVSASQCTVSVASVSSSRASSASKRVRFSSELCSFEGLSHTPSAEPALPLVSVLKTSVTVVGGQSNTVLGDATAGIADTTRKPAPPTSGRDRSHSIKATKPVRPSLSEQLASIGANASALTQDIRTKAGLDRLSDSTDVPLFTMPAKCFTVGNLNCRYPSPVRFFNDRMEYTFHHPFESAEIRMVMYYKDLIGPGITSNKLKFKVPRALTHFPADFDPTNPQHLITIEFTSAGVATSVRQKLLPFVPSFSLSR